MAAGGGFYPRGCVGKPEYIKNLKVGNTKNVGRKKALVREKCAEGFEQAIPSLIEQAINAFDPISGKRPYTIAQQQAATDMLGKYGIGTKAEIESEVTEYQKILHVPEDHY